MGVFKVVVPFFRNLFGHANQDGYAYDFAGTEDGTSVEEEATFDDFRASDDGGQENKSGRPASRWTDRRLSSAQPDPSVPPSFTPTTSVTPMPAVPAPPAQSTVRSAEGGTAVGVQTAAHDEHTVHDMHEDASVAADMSSPEPVDTAVTVERGFLRGAAYLGDDGETRRYDDFVPHMATNIYQQRETIGSVVDVSKHNGVVIGVAATRGMAHQRPNEPTVRQDSVAYSTDASGRYLIAAIADGVSQSKASAYGSMTAVRVAIDTVQRQLEEGMMLENIRWEDVIVRIRDAMTKWYETYHVSRERRNLASMAATLGTTCEVVVVDTVPDQGKGIPVVRAVLAGDGAGYMLRPDGSGIPIEPLGVWELKDGDYDTSRVNALPLDQPDLRERIRTWIINPGECMIVVTDGIGKDMGDGRGRVSKYIHDCLITRGATDNPITQTELLETIQYVAPGSEDDRSVIALWC